MKNIHETAIVSKLAKIDETVKIGPYCIIGDYVVLKKNVNLIANVIIDGKTTIDENTVVFPFTTIGLVPQDLKYNNEKTGVYIVKNNKIRESVTIHIATGDENSVTYIGNNNLIMVGSHVAHDCVIGDFNILSNHVLLAGHVKLGDYVVIGGGSAIHQYARIGDFAFIGGMSGVPRDIVPCAMYTGARDSGFIEGVNITGLRRKGFENNHIQELKEVYSIIFDANSLFLDNIKNFKDKFSNSENPLVNKINSFIDTVTAKNIYVKYKG